MCGIVGYRVRTGDAVPLRDALPMACDALRHRGPDTDGVWYSDLSAEVGFGHRRLSIIDLTEAGSQPMVSADGEYAVIFNGEVYNFAEIARELTARGVRFRGHSDTEVVLESFRAWGPRCVERFIGMFAFAIWDRRERRLSLCRDRVGVKPLYYTWTGRTLRFASELKALRKLPHWAPEIDVQAMGEFLQYGYIGQPRSIYRLVCKLPPGCWLHLNAEGEPRIERYWSLADIVDRGPLTGSERDLEAELEALLLDAIKYRLVSDVPVGLFLSGGVDSSLVAGLLKSAGIDIETFTIGFKVAGYDESDAAAAVSRALGYKNQVEIIDERYATTVLDQWADLYDEPFGDLSGIPTFLVSSMARQRVAVALSADGGDELFCGYSGYSQAAARMATHGRIPAWARGLATRGLDAAMAAGVPRALGGLAIDRVHKLRGCMDATGLDALRPFKSFWQPGELRGLLGASYTDPRLGGLKWDGAPAEQLAALDFHEFLPDDVLAKADRASMAVGLECREPLLDHRVIEMAFRLPLKMRLGSLGNKHALRSILYKHVPRELVDRPKQGFAVPLSRWMNSLIESGAMYKSTAELAAKLGLERSSLAAALATFKASDQGKNRLWLLYLLANWARRWA